MNDALITEVLEAIRKAGQDMLDNARESGDMRYVQGKGNGMLVAAEMLDAAMECYCTDHFNVVCDYHKG